MIILGIFLLLVIIIYSSKYLFGSYINILSIFSFWWYLLLSIALINNENYYNLSLYSTFIFTITPAVVILGSMCSSQLLRIRPIKNLYLAPSYTKFNKIDKMLSVFLWVLVSFLVYIMYTIYVSFNLDFQSLRTLMWSIDAANYHPIFSILTPIKWLSGGILLYLIFKQLYILIYLNFNKGSYYLFLNIFFYVALNLSGGGRGALLDLIILSIVVILLLQPLGRSEKKAYRYKSFINKSFYIFIFSIPSLIIVTSLRGQDESVIYELYQVLNVYFIGPFYAFDQMILNPPDYDFTRFGITFLGLDTILVSGFLRFILNLDVSSLLSQSSYFFHFGVDISNEVRMNAFYTFLLSPHVDGGFYFVIIFLFSIGILLPIAFHKFYYKTSVHNFFYIIFLYYFMLSSTRTSALDSAAWMIFLIIPILVGAAKPLRSKQNKNFKINNKKII